MFSVLITSFQRAAAHESILGEFFLWFSLSLSQSSWLSQICSAYILYCLFF